MKFKPRIGKNTWVIISSLFIIGAIYSIYFLVYVPNQRENLTEENFRILSQHQQNIKNKFSDQVQIEYIQENLEPTDTIEKFVEVLSKVIKNNEESHSDGHKYDEFYALIDNPYKVLYQSIPSNLILPGMDSIKSLHDQPLSAGIVVDMKISEVDYLGFIQRTHVNYTLEGTSGRIDFNICGLIKKKEFHKKTKQVSTWVLTNAIILVLILLLSMPLLKLQLMSPIERLYKSNVIWLGLSIIIGFCFITLIYNSTASLYRSKKHIRSQLDTLSTTLSTNFLKEVEEANTLLKYYDATKWHFKNNKTKNQYQLNTGKDKTDSTIIHMVYEDTSNVLVDKEKKKISRINLTDILFHDTIQTNVLFNDILWVDEDGYLRVVLSASQDSARLPKNTVNVKSRNYFSKVQNNEFWKLSSDTNGSPNFALESIVSWADGAYETAISKKSNATFYEEGDSLKMEAIVVATTLSSVMETILPQGFGFCIIDEDGRTWYNSKKEKIHNENFLDEINGRSTLTAAMQSRAQVSTTFAYSNVDHLALISPIKDVPLQLVVFYDLRFAKYPILQAVRIAVSLLSFSFVLVCFHMIILYFFQNKPSRLKTKQFLFDWLSPKEDQVKEYVLLRNTHLLIIILITLITLLFRFFGPPLQLHYSSVTVFLVLISSIYVFTYTFKILNKKSDFLYASAAYIAILNIGYFIIYNKGFLYALLFQLLLILLIINLQKFMRSIWPLNKKDKNKAYVQFMISWLVLISVLPVFYLYNFSYANEYRTWAKYDLVELAKTTEARELNYSSLQQKLWPNDNTAPERKKEYFSNLNNNGNYYNLLINSEAPDTSDITEFDDRKDNFYKTFKSLRAASPELTNSTRFLRSDVSADNSWTWLKIKCLPSLVLKYKSLLTEKTYYNSNVNPFTHSYYTCFLFWVFLFTSICLLYFIIRYAIGQIYGEDFKDFSHLDLSVEYLKNRSKNNRLLLIKMPYAGTEKIIKKYLEGLDKEDYIKFDLSNIDDRKEMSRLKGEIENYKIFILENFEYMSNNHLIWKKKLKLIKRINQSEEKQIIITSQIHPLDVTKYYELMIQKSSELLTKMKARAQNEEFWHALAQWKKVFSGFIKIYDPIDREESNVMSDSFLTEKLTITKKDDVDYNHKEKQSDLKNKEYDIPDEIKLLIVEELKYGIYLPKLSKLIVDYCIANKITDREDVILRIQSLAQPYYYALWSSLNKDERFLIFDLAKDGFVNLKNETSAKALQEKGLFVYKDKLTLMNESFNNFILTIVSREMERDMERELSKKGSWSIIKIVLVLVVLSIIAFVAQGQQQFMDDLYTLMGAIIAGAGLFLRFGDMNMFSSSEVSAKKVF